MVHCQHPWIVSFGSDHWLQHHHLDWALQLHLVRYVSRRVPSSSLLSPSIADESEAVFDRCSAHTLDAGQDFHAAQ